MPEIAASRFRQGAVLMNAYHRPGDDLGKVPVAVTNYGFPGAPLTREAHLTHQLVRRGWLVLAPEYPGTYGSYGECTFGNALQAPIAAVKVAKRGWAAEVRSGKRLRWKPGRILLAGGSFGGSTSLLASLKTGVRDVVALAPPTRYFGRRDILAYRPIVKRGFENLWRIRPDAWQRLVDTGCGLNALDQVKRLAGKRILLMHAAGDRVVSVVNSRALYSELKGRRGDVSYLEVPGDDHFGTPSLASSRMWPTFVRWWGRGARKDA